MENKREGSCELTRILSSFSGQVSLARSLARSLRPLRSPSLWGSEEVIGRDSVRQCKANAKRGADLRKDPLSMIRRVGGQGYS